MSPIDFDLELFQFYAESILAYVIKDMNKPKDEIHKNVSIQGVSLATTTWMLEYPTIFICFLTGDDEEQICRIKEKVLNNAEGYDISPYRLRLYEEIAKLYADIQISFFEPSTPNVDTKREKLRKFRLDIEVSNYETHRKGRFSNQNPYEYRISLDPTTVVNDVPYTPPPRRIQ